LLPFLATGFLALGAATTCGDLQAAAAPFDKRRSGMILGSGAIGIVLEAANSSLTRAWTPKAEVIGTHHVNSAYHASLIHSEHVASELSMFVERMVKGLGMSKEELAKELAYFSHETSTGVCAKVEIAALEQAFGSKCAREDIVIANTKGFTGHPMGAGFEDVIAVASLERGELPPIANYTCPDPRLGTINLSRGGAHTRRFVLRFAAGFGSQFCFVLLRRWKE
jgi:3-oxoacyl-(acyl-carrier-protein) synthase